MNQPRPFGPYSLLRRLAVGGMAEVYVANARGLGGFEKLVAIKLVHPHLSADSHFVQMLIDEAKILVLLTHTNIAQVFDLGCIDGVYYIAMEFVEGLDVHGLQKATATVGAHLPLPVCCYIASEALNGLDYAHRKRDVTGKSLNLVHRDVSPQNVLISLAGEVKLVDFGIAKTSMRGEGTEVGIIKGKYYYMSPEQAWADPMDRRSDIFSTGIVLYEMLTGRMLYGAQSIPELISKVREAKIAPPNALRSEVPQALSDIVMRALQRDPGSRFQSALDMGEALRDFLYEFAPAFNAGRLAQYLAALFEAKTKVERETAVAKAAGGLARLTRDEFVRNENSVLFKLADVPLATRKEALPHKLRKPAVSAPPTPAGGSAKREPRPPPPSLSPFGDSAPQAGLTHGPMARRVSGWPLAEVPQQEPGADDPTKLWTSSDVGTHMGSDPTLVEDRPTPHESVDGDEPGALVLADAYSSSDSGPTNAYDVSHAALLAQQLPPPSEWPRPVVPAMKGLVPGLPRPASALVPPPGVEAEVGTIPPSPIMPDFSVKSEAFRSVYTRRWPWLSLGLLLVFGLAAAILFQLSRPTAQEPTLEIISVPAGAKVRVNGIVQPGATPITLTALQSGRVYELRVSREGYLPWDAAHTASSGPVQHIAVLKPITAELRVLSVPSRAQVWMDGVLIGRTPLTVASLPVGRKVRLRASYGGATERRQELTIREDELKPVVTFTFAEAD